MKLLALVSLASFAFALAVASAFASASAITGIPAAARYATSTSRASPSAPGATRARLRRSCPAWPISGRRVCRP